MSNLARDHRNSDLVKIQVARKELLLNGKLTEEDYRTVLVSRGGVESSRNLDHEGRQRVLEYFQKLGWKAKASAKPKRPRRPAPKADALPLVRRIRAQLISLDRKPDEYADGIAKQMLGDQCPQFFEWCQIRDLERISQALSYQQKRDGAPTK